MRDGPGWEGAKEGEQSKFGAAVNNSPATQRVKPLLSEAAAPLRCGMLTQLPGPLDKAWMQLTEQDDSGP